MYTTLVASVELDNWSYSGSGWFRTFGRGRLDLRTRALLSLLLSRTLAHKRTTSIADRVNDLVFFEFFCVFVRDFIISGYRYAKVRCTTSYETCIPNGWIELFPIVPRIKYQTITKIYEKLLIHMHFYAVNSIISKVEFSPHLLLSSKKFRLRRAKKVTNFYYFAQN